MPCSIHAKSARHQHRMNAFHPATPMQLSSITSALSPVNSEYTLRCSAKHVLMCAQEGGIRHI